MPEEIIKNNNTTDKIYRKRKKALFKQLKSQMEFYFSDANLQKDRFLNQKIKESSDGYIDLDIFLHFNKIRTLTEDIHDLATSLKRSSFLQIDKVTNKVKRLVPFVESTNVDERTVYIEQLASNSTIESIQKYLGTCGKVVYVSLPRYKTTRDIKGFAFVEFETVEAAQLACKTLNSLPKSSDKPGIFPKASKKCKELEKQIQRTHDMNSDDTKENLKICDKSLKETDLNKSKINNEENKKENLNAKISTSKTKKDNSQSVNDANKLKQKSRKRKVSCGLENEIDGLIEISSKSTKLENPKLEDCEVKNIEIENFNMEGDKKEKTENDGTENVNTNMLNIKNKKIKSKKKKKVISNASKKQDNLENNILVKKSSKNKSKNKNKNMSELRVIPKCEWLKLRGEYIAKQKSNMILLKEKLKMLTKPDDSTTNENTQVANVKSVNKEIAFTPGVVLKFDVTQEYSKKDIKGMLEDKYKIAYVEFNEGDKTGYLRCCDAEVASNLSNESKYDGFTFSLINGADEIKYWEKLNVDRKLKLSTKIKKTKKGKHKLQQKADKYLESLANKQHIVFE